jgi:hyaluronoglucosaminidase
MYSIGVIEGFFGPQWSLKARKSYAVFLAKYGGSFYIYAPKQDPFLRKKWRDPWTEEYRSQLQHLVDYFHHHRIHFGVGFSPFGIGTSFSDHDKVTLQEKVSFLEEMKIDILGLFFDDMPITENLAQTQLQVLDHIRSSFKGKIIFCPSFYSFDPILDKVFGVRPPGYLDQLARGVAPEVKMAWTGPKVISPEISETHLREVENLLKRKPFIWENFYANDGPRNCKFLKLRYFSGRSREACSLISGCGFNMMNQPEISKITYLSSLFVLNDEKNPHEAFNSALEELCSDEFSRFLKGNREVFLTTGLDNIPPHDKKTFIDELLTFPDEAAKEVIDWLSGNFNVGTECLTD